MSRLLSNASFLSKVVLITGASSGIGRETAVHFARLGAHLSLCGRNEVSLSETAAQCEAARLNTTQRLLKTVVDVTVEADVKKLVDATLSEFSGQLDVLVNNAGILEYGSIESTNLEQYDRVMNTNVRSVYHLMMLTVPSLIKTKGSIVNVSSVNGIRSFPNVLAYCVSKSAIDQLTACTAVELGAKGVRVNAVNPGVITTGIQKRGGLSEEQYAAFLERSKETHALGRTGDVSEVASAITFLASDAASYITGATLPVDGGRHALCPR